VLLFEIHRHAQCIFKRQTSRHTRFFLLLVIRKCHTCSSKMRLSFSAWYIPPFALIRHVHEINFGYEATVLTDNDVQGKPGIQFGNLTAAVKANATCKAFPGDSDWPSTQRWAAFNATLGSALIRIKPLGTPCYAGTDYNQAACQQALLNSFSGDYL